MQIRSPLRESLEEQGKETENRGMKTGQFAGFAFLVFRFPFFIPSLFGSGAAGLGSTLGIRRRENG
jgi:hypothetical protein